MRGPLTLDQLLPLMAEAWSDALRVEAKPEDDFLALGGTSVAAITIVQALPLEGPDREALELVALEAIFEQPSMHAMTEQLLAHMRGDV